MIVHLSNGKYLSYEALSGAGAPASGPSPSPSPSPFDSTFSNLDYSGGPVMPSNTNYTIVWNPSNYSGTAFQTGYADGVSTYLLNLAHDSGGTANTDSVATQYNDAQGNTAAYNSSYGGSIADTGPLPSNGCSSGTICLTDAQLQTEIDRVLTADGLPRGLTNEYFLLTPPDVVSCFDPAGTACSGNASTNAKFCAYHSASSTSSSFVYSNIPDMSRVFGCDPFVTSCPNISCNYNNGPADGVLSAVSHEHIESITDPQPNNAWTDYQSGCNSGSPITCGGEIGDKCNGDATSDPNLVPQDNGSGTDTPYNETINGTHYLIQMEWSNHGAGCLDSLASNSPPTASFTSASGSGTNVVNFDASGSTGGVAQYVWQFNDDVRPGDTPQQYTVTTTSPTISHTFPQTGTYTVALTVMTSDGTSRGAANQVVVAAPPSAGFSVAPASPTEGSPVSFTSTSTDPNSGGSITTYSWNFGDSATSTSPNPSHTFSAGTYTVTLTVTNNFGLSSQVSHSVTVADESPTASFSPPGGGVAGTAVSFTGSGSDPDGTISSYSWKFGDGGTSPSQNPSHTFSAGTYTVTLTVTDSSGQMATDSHAVTISPPATTTPPAGTTPPGGTTPPATTTPQGGTIAGGQQCVVPNLKGESLSAARNALSAAHCATSSVKRPKHKPKHKPPRHKKWALVVTDQSPQSYSTGPPGTPVNLTLAYKAVKK